MTNQLIYLAFTFILLVLPRALQRFKIPAPLTCLFIGIGVMVWQTTHNAEAADLISAFSIFGILGISTLFIFAGLEVDLDALKREKWAIVAHLVIRLIAVFLLGWGISHIDGYLIPGLDLDWRAIGLLVFALLTSSTGFIIDTLDRLGLKEHEKFWVTNKAIAAEFLALGALFFLLQSSDLKVFAISSTGLIAMIIALPLIFIALGRWVVPYSPGSEFSLLVMVGLLAAFASYSLGVYYLVGAFIAGLVASLLKRRMPMLASHDNMHGVKLFASFFVPFYFFNAGLKIPFSAISWEALGIGIGITAAVLPLRLLEIWAQRRALFFKKEPSRSSVKTSIALAPTLVFTLVLAAILKDKFNIPDALFGGLILYACLTTILPSLVFKKASQPVYVQPLEEETDTTEAEADLTADTESANSISKDATEDQATANTSDSPITTDKQAA